VRASTAGPRCARTVEIALRLLETTAAVEVDAFGLADADALLLARASSARGVLLHGRVPRSVQPLPVSCPGGSRGGLLGAFLGALAPALAPPPPPPVAGSGSGASPAIAVLEGEEARAAIVPLLAAIAGELRRPISCVTLAELGRWETRRARGAVAEAEVRLRARLERVRGGAGLAESYSHRGIGFADLAAGDLEALLLGHLPATVRRLEAAAELFGAARAPVVLVAVPGRDERRALVLAAAAAGAESVVVCLGGPGDGDGPSADGGPRPLAAVHWSPGEDPAPVAARLGEAARGRVELP
jgi:hypothetical protein